MSVSHLIKSLTTQLAYTAFTCHKGRVTSEWPHASDVKQNHKTNKTTVVPTCFYFYHNDKEISGKDSSLLACDVTLLGM